MMSPSNAQNPGKKKPKGPALPVGGTPTEELVLHGDLSGLTYAFVGRPRRLVTCPVPDSIYQRIQNHPGGVGHFIEDAVAAFDGDLNALVNAAVLFVDTRRFRASTDPPRNASARLLPATFAKIQKIHEALAEIRGMSRAKVIAGVIQLYLSNH